MWCTPYDVMSWIYIWMRWCNVSIFSFGAGQVAVGRHMAGIVTLLGDANSQVRNFS